MMEDQLLEKLLRDRKLLEQSQLDQAKKICQETQKNLREILLEQGWLQEEKLDKIFREVQIFLQNPDAKISLAPKKKPAQPGPFTESLTQVQCPGCKKISSLPSALLNQGKPLQCPHCPHVFRIQQLQENPPDSVKSPSKAPAQSAETKKRKQLPRKSTETKKNQDAKTASSQKETPKKLLVPQKKSPPKKDSPSKALAELAPPSPSSQKLDLENLPPGTPLGKYRVLEKLGEGPRGFVYRAEQISMKRNVAIKILRTQLFGSSTDLLEDFKDLLSLWGSLNDPRIIRIIDIGNLSQNLFYVMPFQEGKNLQAFLRNRIIPERKALNLMGEMARVVESLHKKGVIHFDLQPNNFFISSDGEVVLSDLSLGDFACKYSSPYTPPELLQKQPPSQFASDIYSLGQTFLFLFKHIVQGEKKEGVRKILQKMTQSNWKKRYSQMDHLLKDLQRGGPTQEEEEEEEELAPLQTREALLAVIFAVAVFTGISMIVFSLLKMLF